MRGFCETLYGLSSERIAHWRRDQFALEQRYLASLVWTPKQISAFNERVLGIQLRLARYEIERLDQ